MGINRRWHMFDSYEEVHKFYQRARSKKLGRPVSSGWRVIADNPDADKPVYEFVCTYNGKQVSHFRMRPDNVLEVVGVGNSLGQSPTYVLDKLFGFWIVRFGTGRYSIFGPNQRISSTWFPNPGEFKYYIHNSEDGIPIEIPGRTSKALREHHLTAYFEGTMSFKLIPDAQGAVCLNPVEDPVLRVNSDIRKQWLKDRRWFKQQYLVLARVGTFDKAAEEVVQNKGSAMYPIYAHWGSPYAEYKSRQSAVKAIVQSMKSRQINHVLFTVLSVISCHRTFNDNAEVGYTRFKTAISRYLNNLSLELRTEYGVIEEDYEDGND